MAGDKVENKAQDSKDNNSGFLSTIAMDLLKGYDEVSKFVKDHPAVDVAAGAAVGGVAGAILGNAVIGAAVGGAGALAAEEALKLAEQHKKEIGMAAGVLLPEAHLVDAVTNGAKKVIDHVKQNPAKAAVEALCPPVLIFDSIFGK